MKCPPSPLLPLPCLPCNSTCLDSILDKYLSFSFKGNLLTLLILGQKDLELKPIFRSMLSLLLISDTICILLINLLFTCKLLSLDFALYLLPHMIPWLLPVTQIFLTISVYTTIGVAVERFVSISTHTPPTRVSTFIIDLFLILLKFN